jgi:magnesium chelatase family protein
MKIWSFAPFGYEGQLVEVETDLRRGIPAVDIVGLADGSVIESRKRMKDAVMNSGFDFPAERVLMSLSPADLRKDGSYFELPMALSVISAAESAAEKDDACLSVPVMAVGGLSSGGKLLPVRAVDAAVEAAEASGIKYVIVPEANAKEARCAGKVKVFGAPDLAAAWKATKDLSLFKDFEQTVMPDTSVSFPPASPDSESITADPDAVLALQTAVAGRLNLILEGKQGSGKTLLANYARNLQPLISGDKARSVTRIYSVAGLLPPESGLAREAPFRSPHQAISIEGMCGGGSSCFPGEISLAHNGLLVLDEATEFRASVLQMLRVPLEIKQITLSRAGRSTTYPADFRAVITLSPAASDFTDSLKEHYYGKMGEPVFDRIQIACGVKTDGHKAFSLAELRDGIRKAQEMQYARQGRLNGELSQDEMLSVLSSMPPETRHEYDVIQSEMIPGNLRRSQSLISVSRTLADLDGSESISVLNVRKAAFFCCRTPQDIALTLDNSPAESLRHSFDFSSKESPEKGREK